MCKYLANVRHITQAGAYDSQPDPVGLDKLPGGQSPPCVVHGKSHHGSVLLLLDQGLVTSGGHL